jgi:hypothetical protein
MISAKWMTNESSDRSIVLPKSEVVKENRAAIQAAKSEAFPAPA